ncbi:MAG: hypothetical protein LC751_16215, partial [Actinobacteria bacterium]|nr:hypothetical protein [Actinomycetota bacterium]
SAPGGRELSETRVTGSDAAIQTYGSGWGAVTLVQKSESADESQTGQSQEGSSGHDKDAQGGQSQVPTVDLGGVEAKEISTPIGTALSWSVDGVSYSLVGSAPAAELEDAARGLLGQA